MERSCAVVVVERSTLLRECLNRIIANRKFRIAAALSSMKDLAADTLPRDCPILLVLGFRDKATTAQEIKTFRQQCPNARIAVLAENHNTDDIVMSFRAGADAYLAELACRNDLIKSLELVMSGETLLTSAALSRILDRPQGSEDRARWSALDAEAEAPVSASTGDDIPPLSARERTILGYLVAGKSNKVIASGIGVAEATVKVHVKSILRKIRVLNRTQAAIWASRHRYALESADASTHEALGLGMIVADQGKRLQGTRPEGARHESYAGDCVTRSIRRRGEPAF